MNSPQSEKKSNNNNSEKKEGKKRTINKEKNKHANLKPKAIANTNTTPCLLRDDGRA